MELVAVTNNILNTIRYVERYDFLYKSVWCWSVRPVRSKCRKYVIFLFGFRIPLYDVGVLRRTGNPAFGTGQIIENRYQNCISRDHPANTLKCTFNMKLYYVLDLRQHHPLRCFRNVLPSHGKHLPDNSQNRWARFSGLCVWPLTPGAPRPSENIHSPRSISCLISRGLEVPSVVWALHYL